MLAQLTSDGAALRGAAADVDRPVPTCPGWTVRDAVEHTAVVYAHKATIIEQDLLRPMNPTLTLSLMVASAPSSNS